MKFERYVHQSNGWYKYLFIKVNFDHFPLLKAVRGLLGNGSRIWIVFYFVWVNFNLKIIPDLNISFTLAFGLKVRALWRAPVTCRTSSFRIPSSRSCFGSTLITPTSVDFMASKPSVNTEMSWVSLATWKRITIRIIRRQKD